MDLNEKFLYHIWDAGHLKHDLKTLSGKSLKIIYQGQFNTDRGPDFRNSIIEIEGSTYRGDIEIHLKTSDWNSHNHAEDNHYNGLILHIVLQHNLTSPYTILEDGGQAEILELGNYLSDDIDKLMNLHQSEPEVAINSYCELLSAVETDTLISLLNVLGKQRFLSKVKRFNAGLGLSSFDQIIWEGMMESIGYNKNKMNMVQLAQNVTMDMIKGWINDGAELNEMISILLVSSGLLSRSGKLLGQELCERITSTYERQRYFYRKLDPDWQLFRIRPANHPLYRLIHLTRLVYATPNLLTDFLLREELLAEEPKALKRGLAKLFNLPPCEAYDDLPKLGSGTLSTMLVNILIPIQYLYYQKIGDNLMTKRLMNSYSAQPGLADNYITRFMMSHLNPGQEERVSSREIWQQGLIELYYRHCRFHLCRECKESYLRLEDM